MHFPVSGVDVHPLVPPLVAFVVALIGTPAGGTGAFLLLPFQVSVLGFTAPSVSATNLVYNVVASPGGIWRYKKEGRIDPTLMKHILLGTLPGVFVGAYLRIEYLPDADSFRLLVGLLLLPLGIKLIIDAIRTRHDEGDEGGETSTGYVIFLALIVGVAGGIYGIGGSAIISPILVGILGLAASRVVGAALVGTFVTSIIGVATFYVLSTEPDWALGLLFGIGGLAGSYTGARFRNRLPEAGIRALLGVLAGTLGAIYVLT